MDWTLVVPRWDEAWSGFGGGDYHRDMPESPEWRPLRDFDGEKIPESERLQVLRAKWRDSTKQISLSR